MIVKIADNILSPLGITTEANLRAVVEGRSALARHEGLWQLPEPFVGSLLDRKAVGALWEEYASLHSHCEGYTFFEQISILSIARAIEQCGIDPASPEVFFILSTTKGNVGLLGKAEAEQVRISPAASVAAIAQHFGNPNQPLVVSNACTSGLCAQIEALRAVEAGLCRYAIVCGAEEQSRFIVAGFQSFKALADAECKPYDAERTGLNLGEAAATIIYARAEQGMHGWCATDGAIRNDANHISGPSRTGEGSFRALQAVLHDGDAQRLATISLHGTATAYNDEMESIALHRAGLDAVPTGSLKGTFGHTMGAAGVVETLLTMHALEEGLLLPTRGYHTCGTTHPLNISADLRKTQHRTFVKLLSGFGGCNAAMRFEYNDAIAETMPRQMPELSVEASVALSPADGALDEIYRSQVGDYPKYFKMDGLSKLCFLAAEQLRHAHPIGEQTAVLLFGHHGSIGADTHFQQTIQHAEAYFPSPSVFVYTLPNIATGELAIRHHLHCETNVVLLDKPDEALMHQLAALALTDTEASALICGWVDYIDENHYNANIQLITPQR